MHFILGGGSAVLEVVLPVVKFLLGPHIRHRFQIHKGSDLEVIRYMKTFGLGEEHVIPAFRGDLYNQQQCEMYLHAKGLLGRLDEDEQSLDSSDEASESAD